ncbi:MAG: HPF/RaiA family ribosome-associated protein [Gammaproteobacteria bacterium]
MKVQLRALGFDLTGALSEYVGRRLDFAFGRFGGGIRRVEVMLSDENGPRGGRDKRCQVRLVPEGQAPVHVLERQEDLYVAIDRALERAAHALARRKDRRLRHARGRAAHPAVLFAGEG